ncbi:MAG: hypothetical protein Q8K66_07280 [Sediminibacterium sp.]|nr:hypothetical protein [Sediminibacterium sp.]MDP3128696.1 hypothetical protein [Sediminibacterium sp.]
MVYFGKSQSLEAVFIRINPDNGIVSYPFTGNYEFIDLNKFTYKQITFNNGKIGQVFQNLMIDKGSISGAQTVKTNSWFSQLLHCIGQYILAVPAKINGEWSGCWVLGSQGQDQEFETMGEGTGGNTLPIDWASFLININPPVTGPDPIPTGGTGVWALYTPPAYVPPIDPSTFWIGSFLQGDDLYSLSELDAYAQGLGYYWEDPSYDVNSNTFPPYDPIVDGPYDFQGYRKNGPSYQYVGGTVQNYTNDNGGKYAIFTSTNGTQTTFPGATITDYLVLPRAGVTTANGGIHMSTISNGLSDLQHEYGHYLQAQALGFFLLL